MCGQRRFDCVKSSIYVGEYLGGIAKLWQKEWEEENKGRFYFSIQPANTVTHVKYKNGQGNVVITRLRLGHCASKKAGTGWQAPIWKMHLWRGRNYEACFDGRRTNYHTERGLTQAELSKAGVKRLLIEVNTHGGSTL